MKPSAALLLVLAGCSSSPTASPDMALDLRVPDDLVMLPDLTPEPPPIVAPTCADWTQGSHDGAHTGTVCSTGQGLGTVLADHVFDQFTVAERADNMGEITAHYQVPLVVGDDIYMEWKSGQYTSVDNLGSQKWNETRYHWNGSSLDSVWVFPTDWKPLPQIPWEPVFQPVVVGDAIWVPAAAGSLWQVDRRSGMSLARVNPFGTQLDPTIYVMSGLTADDAGNLYYTAMQYDQTNLAPMSWLVKVAPDGTTKKVDFPSLVPNAPGADDNCELTYDQNIWPLPWPPPAMGDAGVPSPIFDACGGQRAALNAAPAIGSDGTIFVVSVAHNNERYGYVIAVNPDLTPKWATSLRGYLNDGCGVLVPEDDDPQHCSVGATMGVDPWTNDTPAGAVDDSSSSSPVALPDGGVLYGALTYYNEARGHLFKLDASGKIAGTYDFGWDTTPAVRAHDNTYSIVLKDNHYENNLGPYYITQLDANLKVEWHFQSTNTKSCKRDSMGMLICTDDHPHGFEWCVNAIAIDMAGVVYANSEDGNVYSILPGGSGRDHLFLNLALGAAYTPVAMGRTGLIYALNDGHLTAVGK
jgi:hypothetical protein